MPEPIPWPPETPEHIRRPVPPMCTRCRRSHPVADPCERVLPTPEHLRAPK